jgi:hypothetical protein
MDDRSLWRQSILVQLRTRPAIWSAIAGLLLDVATVIVCALDLVSDQQGIAMALPAGLITAGGFIALLVPDPWHAWRRGFRHGCEAAARCDPCSTTADLAQKGFRNARLSA